MNFENYLEIEQPSFIDIQYLIKTLGINPPLEYINFLQKKCGYVPTKESLIINGRSFSLGVFLHPYVLFEENENYPYGICNAISNLENLGYSVIEHIPFQDDNENGLYCINTYENTIYYITTELTKEEFNPILISNSFEDYLALISIEEK